ncbi:AAA family ATPase [Dactylosporangium fulvum]|uniref:AAA family ATPase n=1 Tax=Dactylosporangium fulvum TaxID=53359 RepID=A0ABY5WA96_9ACTN|nr:AAA family ATPase [Dactylosporangium fulvum]UWP86992.1 AAA family ATPase [Dactylosporangium fulvum]
MTVLGSPPPLAWYGSSFAYYEEDPAPTEAELNAAAAGRRADRLARFSPEQFGPRPGGGDSSGVVLGRFLPVHDGHRYLIEYARAYAGRVFAFVRAGNDPIPWPVRRDWLTELFPDVTVVPVESRPGTPTDNAPRWAEQIRAHVNPDYVFAGEDRDAFMASLLEAQFVRVDRQAIPVSGTQVRADPWAWERHLPPGVRAWYVRRVCLIGPESTGKSTLARRLAEHYGTVYVPDPARPASGFFKPSDIPLFAHQQQTAAALLARRASRVLFYDTNPLSLRLWSERLFDAAADWMRTAGEDDGIDLYLLTAPDVPFSGIDEYNQPAERADFHARCERELTRLGRAYVPIAGDHEQRFARAVEAVDALLARPAA